MYEAVLKYMYCMHPPSIVFGSRHTAAEGTVAVVGKAGVASAGGSTKRTVWAGPRVEACCTGSCSWGDYCTGNCLWADNWWVDNWGVVEWVGQEQACVVAENEVQAFPHYYWGCSKIGRGLALAAEAARRRKMGGCRPWTSLALSLALSFAWGACWMRVGWASGSKNGVVVRGQASTIRDCWEDTVPAASVAPPFSRP